MQIIVIPGRVAKPRSITLSAYHFIIGFLIVGMVTTSVALGLYWLTLRLGPSIRIPVLTPIIDALQRTESERSRAFMQRNLNAMAVKLGEMQAQLTRLDALGERLSSITGIKPQEFKFYQPPGLGGPEATTIPPHDLTLAEFEQRLLALSSDVENRSDMLSVFDAQLFEQTVQKKLLPTISPVDAPLSASGFGFRIDPFTGQRTLHEGMDFTADVGTPIVSAAGGVVVYAGPHPQYGMLVEIDHGNDLSTRYAHLSRIQVREGDVVHRGRRIGDSGNSGRSTGPHLHFEVRFRGIAQNPARFLEIGKTAAKAADRGGASLRN